MLTGCAKTLTDENKKPVKLDTGKTLTENVLCRPTDEKVIKVYEKNKVEVKKLPECKNFKPYKEYEGLWTTLFVKPLAWVIIKMGYLFEKINDYANVKSLLKNVNEDSIIIIEKEVYDYYKDSSLKDFSFRFIDDIKLNNSFLLNKDNQSFNKLFDFYLSTLSSNEVKNESVYSIIDTLKNNKVFNFIVSNLLYIVIGLLILGFVIYGIVKKVTSIKKIEKEDRLYYFDAMTNLKNRNYLNDNIEY